MSLRRFNSSSSSKSSSAESRLCTICSTAVIDFRFLPSASNGTLRHMAACSADAGPDIESLHLKHNNPHHQHQLMMFHYQLTPVSLSLALVLFNCHKIFLNIFQARLVNKGARIPMGKATGNRVIIIPQT